MTENEQDAVIGATARQFGEAKTRRAALVAKAGQMAEAQKTLERGLRHIESKGVSLGVPDGYPDRADIAALLTEFREVSETIQKCKQILRDAGIDIG